jgi:hypothetical protein
MDKEFKLLRIEKTNQELEKMLIDKAKSFNLKCKIKQTFHGTTGLLFNKRNYICEVNRVENETEAEHEFKRCLEWIENYILYNKAKKLTDPFIIRWFNKIKDLIFSGTIENWKKLKTDKTDEPLKTSQQLYEEAMEKN